MSEDVLELLKAQVRVPQGGDKVAVDKRLKAEILLLRAHAHILEDKPGRFVCEAAHGKGVVDQKEATLLHTTTRQPVRWQLYKSHLFAVHSVLCWAVLGISIG